jgi:hypothetical protein
MTAMAFSVQVIGIPRSDRELRWVVEEVAWPARELQADPRFRAVDLDGTLYLDYIAVLSVREALAINRRYREHPSEHLRRTNEDLEARLAAHDGGLVVVKVFEWESGLG